jgi:DNA (cytosine-5)-methyltransferase 1
VAIWLQNFNANGWQSDAALSIDEPAPTVQAAGLGGDNWANWNLARDARPMPDVVPVDKPAYRVPTMAEIRALPWNGLTVASTFSGAGGSCVGYAMAGYRVAWASEFLEAAARVHRANFPGCVLDTTDVRQVDAADVLKVLHLKVGELDLLDGSPPCQSFSMSGRRDAHWGKVINHGDGTRQRSDDLFFDYVRLLESLQPRAFVAENVEGLIRGTARGYYNRISQALQRAGYVVECRLLNAKWLGVPQNRPRVIFVGVRADLGVAPVHPTPLPYWYSTREAMAGLPGWDDASMRVVHDTRGLHSTGTSTDKPSPAITVAGSSGAGASAHFRVMSVQEGAFPKKWRDANEPSPTIMAGRTTNVSTGGMERRRFTIPEVMRLCSFPDDFQLDGTYGELRRAVGQAGQRRAAADGGARRRGAARARIPADGARRQAAAGGVMAGMTAERKEQLLDALCDRLAEALARLTDPVSVDALHLMACRWCWFRKPGRGRSGAIYAARELLRIASRRIAA